MNFITISRKIGTAGSMIAEKVAREIGYNFVDTEAIMKKAGEMGFSGDVEKIDEKRPSLFNRLFSHEPAIGLNRLNSVIYELANEGDAVFVGRGGHMLLRSFDCALHVRITGSHETCLQNLVNRGFTPDAAKHRIESVTRERSAFIKYAFGKEIEDPKQYDVTFNMDKLTADSVIDTIVQMAGSDKIKAVCSYDALESLGKLALRDRVDAALLESGVSWGLNSTVNVFVEEAGQVILKGSVDDTASTIRAEEVSKGVKGVEKVINEIRITPADRHA